MTYIVGVLSPCYCKENSWYLIRKQLQGVAAESGISVRVATSISNSIQKAVAMIQMLSELVLIPDRMMSTS